ncbi:hypothetical protein BAE44_0026289 [Dichanthelium oligosanthes]|uniref:Uncharacterized protein n=1 Tax=Dichanthelium oligosanthes TaxID=888268 RepID=A0A1E5UII0_9POAL|nr:hypothetical protein BAE44_0026289 [Dichanthelium oligosanthes]
MDDEKVFKTRLLARDAAARVSRSEMVVEGSALAAQLNSQVSEVRVTPASESASCVVSVTVEYERLNGEGDARRRGHQLRGQRHGGVRAPRWHAAGAQGPGQTRAEIPRPRQEGLGVPHHAPR